MSLIVANQLTREGRRVMVAELPAAIVGFVVALAEAWGLTRSDVIDELLRRCEVAELSGSDS
ncbi:MAG: hypothetical protein ACYDGN_16275 [Acidimicrobiales bacterium]